MFDLYRIWCSTFIGFSVRPLSDSVFEVEWILHVVRKLPGRYEDWLISMISSQLNQDIPGFDEIILPSDSDFSESGLKIASLIRIGRIAVVNSDILLGSIGQISDTRLQRIRQKLSDWLQSNQTEV